ncbi:MAG: hypothetical protein GAK28_00177 [Luteibacter sp.]|uniref:hypothetical protein n=1 Tax=Luteibacter sp. TaxID=1886636 RepID=UPI0013804CAA|nr:hypothetical protein [Luteibacter sp.]KAF1009539.1 MAG: hypothetical protein GAK28_00177 [Luteibacter sp.]
MSMEYVRRYYGVPARRGGRVEYTGCGIVEMGTIRSATGSNLNIQLDGVKHAMPFHPTWKLRYIDQPTDTLTAGDGEVPHGRR